MKFKDFINEKNIDWKNFGDVVKKLIDKKGLVSITAAVVNNSSIEATGDDKELEILKAELEKNWLSSDMYVKIKKGRIAILDESDVNEAAKLVKDSIMFNGRVSSEINVGTEYDRTPKFSIWINGGTAYEFSGFDAGALAKIREMGWKEQEALASEIAAKVAKAVEKEVKDLEKKLR
jgi:hypothetical protein